jgi:hypothetical protein
MHIFIYITKNVLYSKQKYECKVHFSEAVGRKVCHVVSVVRGICYRFTECEMFLMLVHVFE